MTMRYRRLDKDHDYTFGQGRGSYLTGVDAVAQAIMTRLLLFTGEWWEDREDGLPLWQKMLGAYKVRPEAIDRLIQARILGTPNVTGISSIQSGFNVETRSYSFTAVVDTAFGQVTVTNQGVY